ncbi:MAG: sigma-54-dependent Fis family transcriptional regulator [Ignavibacterium sp.]|nr:MAG: sigma-54-dependent Fis family transcriptional regulator [Ignavibacterium sp.]
MTKNILVVDDEQIIRESLSYILRKENYTVDEAENGKAAYDILLETNYDLVITDLEMPEMKGTELLEKIRDLSAQTATIVVTAYGSLETAISALRTGASDYILKPIEFDELLIKVKKLFEMKDLITENQILRSELQRTTEDRKIIGKSYAIRKIFDLIDSVADTDSTVLITGKSGTGKELVAKALHFTSKRKDKPFVVVNCGAISDTLIESELFGHKKGAFTGAVSDKEGFMKAANGGTLFLDEIGEMPLDLQVKLLRTIQEKEYTPVGTTKAIPVNVRFVASTNKNLPDEIKAGNFREDLFYRLNVVEIVLPSLKDRKEDIPILANHFVDKYRKEMNKPIKGISEDAMRVLINHEWKGEVRELENVIERSIIFCNDDYIGVNNLPSSLIVDEQEFNLSLTNSLEDSVKKYERDIIINALNSNDFNKEKTADYLNVGLSTLYRRLKDLNIEL